MYPTDEKLAPVDAFSQWLKERLFVPDSLQGPGLRNTCQSLQNRKVIFLKLDDFIKRSQKWDQITLDKVQQIIITGGRSLP
jgi:hypothetical protein